MAVHVCTVCLFILICLWSTWITVVRGDCSTVFQNTPTFQNCQYRCHCKNDAQCVETTGDCNSGCEFGWMGQGCQYRNVAKYNSGNENVGGTDISADYSIRAVDGDINTCARTHGNGVPPNGYHYWRIEWPEVYRIVGLVLKIRSEDVGNFSKFRVETGSGSNDGDFNFVCYQHGDTPGTPEMEIMCTQPVWTQHLRIILGLPNVRLGLCEVEIYGGRAVTFNKPTNQSSTYATSYSYLSVDGKAHISGFEAERTCSTTGGNELNPYWMVDFLAEFVVQSVYFYGRLEQYNEQYSEFQISLLNDSSEGIQIFQAHENDEVSQYQPKIVHLTTGVTARFLKIIRPHDNTLLTICEVVTFAECPPNKCGLNCSLECYCIAETTGTYRRDGNCPYRCSGRWTGIGSKCNIECNVTNWGDQCQNTCGNCASAETCNVVNGHCEHGCSGPWYPPKCSLECNNNTYGINCSQNCGNCKSSAQCNISSGECMVGCDAGWEPPLCQEACAAGYYGDNCDKKCGNCYGAAACNPTTGVCDDGCDPGYQTILCNETCKPGWYGLNCSDICGQCANGNACNISTGLCSDGCLPGWTIGYCNESCDEGTYGEGCSSVCGNCSEGHNCNHTTGFCENGCAAGFEGELCNTTCSYGEYGPNCDERCGYCNDSTDCDVETGHCSEGCLPGWKDIFCNASCDEGTYGKGCTGVCGNCSEEQSCNHTSGLCDNGCAAGFKGDLCNTACSSGEYGPNCAKQCGFCNRSADCHEESGQCPYGCLPGWKGILCEKSCGIGTHGQNCSSKCGNCAIIAQCNTTTGECSEGCMEGFDGLLCLIEKPGTTSTGMILGILAGALVVCGTSIVAFFLFRRRRNMQSKTQKSEAGDCSTFTNSIVIFDDDNADTDQNRGTVYVNSALKTNDIEVSDLRKVCVSAKQNPETLYSDFSELPYGLQFDASEARDPRNKSKNRYRDMYPYNANRVHLPEIPGNDYSTYINASYIKGYTVPKKYIASQGALESTIADLWRMVWSENVTTIVMLTNCVELGKVKCVKYWPDEATEIYGDITVRLEKFDPYSDFIIRTFCCTKVNSDENRTVVQFHYTAWPDKDVPDTALSLVQFWRTLRHCYTTESYPWIVHCSAGVGRTGTFVALDYLYEMGTAEHSVNIQETVNTLREQRLNMVQTKEQYVYVHEAVAEVLNPIGCVSQNDEFPDLFQSLFYDNGAPKQKLRNEFEDINKYNSELEVKHNDEDEVYCNVFRAHCADAKREENIGKSRDLTIIPADIYRPRLSLVVAGRNDFINAVFIPTFRYRNKLILTQVPLENTIVDFLRMVWEYDVPIVVLLEEILEEKSSYVPTSPTTKKIDVFTVELRNERVEDCYVKRTIVLSLHGRTEQKEVQLFQIKSWPKDKSTPIDTGSMLRLVSDIENNINARGPAPIIVQCLNGATKSGLFSTLWCMLERSKSGNETALAEIVRMARLRRKQIIADFEQYKYCYLVMRDYLDSFNVYANTF